MSLNQGLLQQLEQMLCWKKSKKVYAEKLGVTEEMVDELLKELRNKERVRDDAEVAHYIDVLEELVVKVNNEKGTMESTIET